MLDTSVLNRHTKIALSFSGGKDSLACVYLLRPHLDRITLYHNDTGDLLPEMRETVEHVRGFAPNFVHMQGDVMGWQERNGLPTDLLPYSAHDVGRMVGQPGARLTTRYACCYTNLMHPLWERIKADGITLLIRGTKTVDLKRLPTRSGDMAEGVEIWHPIEDWSHERVFAYLRSVKAPLPRIYERSINSPECARCSAWWGEKRAAYLKEYHPELFTEYAARLRIVTGEIIESVNNLNRELGVANG
jgi:3'-phosphoadenosine 5'-phosphosulfate sulfotransferase (PAPS reductase)/FAD synthetase